ncbi:hypothetical protein BBJ28_00014811, partial [Nothophytophthora sp. Chile5]
GLKAPVELDSDEDELESAEREMVLSKEEFDMLQTFHRFVPLPALTSRILRVYCEDDLQVPEGPHTDRSSHEDDEVEATKPRQIEQSWRKEADGNDMVLRHPRRLSKERKKKPHFKINLATQTPRHAQQQQGQSLNDGSSARRMTFEASERPETQE